MKNNLPTTTTTTKSNTLMIIINRNGMNGTHKLITYC